MGHVRCPQSEPTNNDLRPGRAWRVATTNSERVGGSIAKRWLGTCGRGTLPFLPRNLRTDRIENQLFRSPGNQRSTASQKRSESRICVAKKLVVILQANQTFRDATQEVPSANPSSPNGQALKRGNQETVNALAMCMP